MQKICIATGSALAASLALAGAARGQCANGCGGGDVAEAEACVTVDADRVNDGCNLATPAFGAVVAPVTVCGRGSTLDAGGSRDTDWYKITQANLMAGDTNGDGFVQVRASVLSEFPGVVFIISLGDPQCSAVLVVDNGFGGPGCVAGEPAKATLEIAEHPNGVVVFVATGNPDGSAIFDGFPCSGGANDYTLDIEMLELPLACSPDNEPCGTPHAGPGCDDPACCKDVCDSDPFCCEEAWDENCVSEAVLIGCVCATIPGLQGVPAPASDNFDAYANNTLLTGVNGWGGWDGAAGAVARVSNLQSHSAPHSVLIDATDDQVQQYTGAECEGQWTYTAWQYVPSTMTGQSYFILLNGYSDPGFPGGDENWSSQVWFNNASPNGPRVHSDFDAAELPLITNQWVEIRVEIDLDNDTQTFFYGGTQLYSKSWSAGVSGGGALAIRAVDLYANAATPVFYDDISLSPAAPPCPWDCQAVPDGNVGINDLLDLLAQWGGAGPCDFDGGGVGITDLLKLLAQWGPCN